MELQAGTSLGNTRTLSERTSTRNASRGLRGWDVSKIRIEVGRDCVGTGW